MRIKDVKTKKVYNVIDALLFFEEFERPQDLIILGDDDVRT